MDRTPRYAEMAVKAKEMQMRWKPQDGDWFAIKKNLLSEGESYAKKGEVYQVAYVAHGRIHFAQYQKGNSEPETLEYHLQHLHKPKLFKLTWLPTQGQSQDILKERARKNQGFARTYIGDEHLEGFITRCVLADFLRWEAKEGIDCPFISMEQFWLAFCMHEIYKKNWDDGGREWMYLTRRERIGYIPLTA